MVHSNGYKTRNGHKTGCMNYTCRGYSCHGNYRRDNLCLLVHHHYIRNHHVMNKLTCYRHHCNYVVQHCSHGCHQYLASCYLYRPLYYHGTIAPLVLNLSLVKNLHLPASWTSPVSTAATAAFS